MKKQFLLHNNFLIKTFLELRMVDGHQKNVGIERSSLYDLFPATL
jgi:hypothetical protein